MAVFEDQLGQTNPVWVAVAGICVWAGYKLARYGQRESYLPPGPPTRFLVGNIPIWPKVAPHYQFTEWAAQYGEIFSLKFAHKTYVIVNSYAALHNIMEKKSAFSSDRPATYLKELIEGQDNNLATARYSDKWRSLRRAAQQILSPHACRSHLAVQQAESSQLMYEILVNPKDALLHIRRTNTSVINSVMFGVRFPRPTTPLYLEFWEMLELAVKQSSPTGRPPVDLFPILRFIPERWALWKAECRYMRSLQLSVYSKMLKPVKDRLGRGVGNGAFMEDVYLRAKEWNLGEEAILSFGYVMMNAGSETSTTFLQIFLLCLAAHPEVLKKIHEEMDTVIGADRMPELDDFEKLPYLQAVVSETHRFRPTIALAVPHAASEDIPYKQYVIPKGAVIWQNSWAVLRDPELFEDGDSFDPERFIRNPELHRYADYAFGSGRRACVGIHLAHNTIKINTMNLVWSFNVTKELSASGQEIEPDLDFRRSGIISGPTDLRVTMKPRSAHHEQIIRQTFKGTSESFRPFEYDLKEGERLAAEKFRAEV